jgi:3-oxosteroid 1-dehydrogenase
MNPGNGQHDGGAAPPFGPVDVVVAGTGAAGLTAAIAAASEGARVVVFDKAPVAGGTTRKSAAWFWIPNNRLMREAGLADPRQQALEYMARLSRPARFDAHHPTLGLPAWEFEGLSTFYDYGAAVTEELERLGALELGGNLDFPDYYAHLDVDAAPRGRTLWPARAGGAQVGGLLLVEDLLAAAGRLGVQVHTGHAVTDVLLGVDGEVTGVQVRRPDGAVSDVGARAAIFGSGGFTHDSDLRLQYLNGPYVGGCASRTNTGDFLRIAQRLGADLANLGHAWSAPIVIERAMRDADTVAGSFSIAGDALLFVNCAGERFVNEKAPYNEIALSQFSWDPGTASYPNLPLIALWDRGVADRFGGTDFGNPVPPPEVDGYWVVSGSHLDELADQLAGRLATMRSLTGSARLADTFVERLRSTIDRFNSFARSGTDDDFGRGQTPIELAGAAMMGESGAANPTMRPFQPDGPYFATILGPGTLDTKGGPRVDVAGRVLRVDGSPIPGLYGAGNAVAAPSGQGYWGGGGTIGPIMCFAFLAGRAAGRAVGAGASTPAPSTVAATP